MPFDEVNHLFIGVRNCTHLLAADSEGVKKIQQDHFVLCPCPGQSSVKILLPFDCLCHMYPPFGEMKLLLQHIIPTNVIVLHEYKERGASRTDLMDCIERFLGQA